MWDWAIYGALIAGTLAILAAAALLGVRVLQGWRTFKRARRHLGKELGRLADLGEQTAEKLDTATDSAELTRSLGSLRGALAQLAVLRGAMDEVDETFAPVAAVYPRK